MRSTLMKLVMALTAVVVVCVILQAEPAVAPPASGQSAPVADDVGVVSLRAASAAPAGPVTQLLYNDPRHRPHVISDAIVANIARVPVGEEIDVTTYWISSHRIARALIAAVRRGVHIHLILAGNGKARGFGLSRRLMRTLAASGNPDSWGIWSKGAARGPRGLMHQKSYLFSRVGDQRWVVMNGSYNSADSSDRYTYAMMWQVVGDRSLYDTFSSIGREQTHQRTLRRPLRTAAGTGWSAYFLPTADRPESDPVMARLRAIPGRPGTLIRIQMYSMWGPRGEWVARRLAAMRRGGARISLIAGPTVSVPVRGILGHAGVTVLPGCFADHTFTHSKDMAASWVGEGSRRFRTWVGSDNWTPQSTASDEAVLGVDGVEGF